MALSKKEKVEKEIFELRDELEIYRATAESPEHLYIGLFGRSGCGKTSLINSLKCAVSGPTRKEKWFPVGNPDKAGGHTLFRVIALLKGQISVIDNRGLDDLTKDGVLQELKAQIDGKRGFSMEVKWEKPKGAADKYDIIDVEKGKYVIGCSVLVFSARDNILLSTYGLLKIVELLLAQQGRYPVAVITNVDNATSQRVGAIKAVLQGAGISEIFEVANITETKRDLEVSYQLCLLSLLERCMTDGDEAAVFRHHQQEEQNAADLRETQRKKGILKKGAVISGAAGTGALIGTIGGPPGSVVGAGVGAVVGGISLLFRKWFY